MKKLLFIVPSMVGGGVERCLLNILNSLDLSKYQVTVLAIRSGGELAKEIPQGIVYRYCWKKSINIGKWRVPGVDRLFHFVFRHLSSKTLHCLFVRDSFDVEIDYWGQEGLKLILGSDENTKKVIFTHFDMNTEGMRRSYFPYPSHEKLRAAYLKADVIANVSNDCKKSMIDRFSFDETEQQKLVVSYNINLNDRILKKADEPLDEIEKNAFTLCACGRLHPVKGFDRLIRICKTLKDENFSFVLWIMGTGDEQEHLKQLIEELDLCDMVKLLGFQSNPYKFIKNSDLFVCSSFFEGFSTVVSEAVILGTPSVTTNCTGAREILGDCEFGLITDMDDDSLCAGIRALLSDSKLYENYQHKVLERQSFFDTVTRLKEFETLL